MPQEYKASLRVDKWLWAARFFKTRSQAADAIAKNRIRVGGQKIKPSRALQIGDVVLIEKPPYRFEVTVLGLNDQRRPAVEAALLYEEHATSVAEREALAVRLRADRLASGASSATGRPMGRPNRNQRRQIIRFRTVQSAGGAEAAARADVVRDAVSTQRSARGSDSVAGSDDPDVLPAAGRPDEPAG